MAHLRALEVNVPDAQKKLTKREVEIARLLVAGLTDTEICQALYLASGTVGTHVNNINEKLAINNRSGLFLMLLLRGYLSLGDISSLQKEAVETRRRICIEVSSP